MATAEGIWKTIHTLDLILAQDTYTGHMLAPCHDPKAGNLDVGKHTHILLTMVRPTASDLDALAQPGPTVTGLFVCLSSTVKCIHAYVRMRFDRKQRLWKKHASGAKTHHTHTSEPEETSNTCTPKLFRTLGSRLGPLKRTHTRVCVQT